MAWKAHEVRDVRLEFVKAAAELGCTFAALCRQFEVSRPTGYKWVERYRPGDESSLDDRPSTPKHVPHRLDEATSKLILSLRSKRPSWGSKKLLAWLARAHPERARWPARSTVDALLKRHGLVRGRRRRKRVPRHSEPLAHAQQPNDLWCIDFKGQFRLASGGYCYPFTVTDAATRYVLCCVPLQSTHAEGVVKALMATFTRYGLPTAIRSDNGTPFATTAPGALSRVSVLLHRLGIRHERIEPGHPEQNGRHERFHLTLKSEACEPAPRSAKQAQRVFDTFVRDFNEERPHESLGMRAPADVYVLSSRPMPRRVPPVSTANADHVRSVSIAGHFKWRGHKVFLTSALAHERVSLRARDESFYEVRFGDIELGVLHDVPGAPRLLLRGDKPSQSRRRQPRGSAAQV